MHFYVIYHLIVCSYESLTQRSINYRLSLLSLYLLIKDMPPCCTFTCLLAKEGEIIPPLLALLPDRGDAITQVSRCRRNAFNITRINLFIFYSIREFKVCSGGWVIYSTWLCFASITPPPVSLCLASESLAFSGRSLLIYLCASFVKRLVCHNRHH